jgi:hypothetical protein
MTNEQQPVAPVYAPAPTAQPKNGFGLAALIIGIIALVGAFIPFLNFGAWFLGLIGLIFGIIGLVAKNRPRGRAIAGTIISVIAIILSIVLAITYTAAFATGVSQAISSASAAADVDVPIIYQVTGDGTATINYSTYSNGTSGSESATGQTLPFEKDVTAKTGGSFSFNSFTLSAIGDADTTTVTCTITANGKVVSTQTSTGPFSSVSCSATGTDLTK